MKLRIQVKIGFSIVYNKFELEEISKLRRLNKTILFMKLRRPPIDNYAK